MRVIIYGDMVSVGTCFKRQHVYSFSLATTVRPTTQMVTKPHTQLPMLEPAKVIKKHKKAKPSKTDGKLIFLWPVHDYLRLFCFLVDNVVGFIYLHTKTVFDLRLILNSE